MINVGAVLRKHSVLLATLLVGCFVASGVVVTAEETSITPEQNEFFESKVRPLLVEHCYGCHSIEAEEIEAGLVLDSKWGWETGGESGPAIEPGDVEESLLIEAIRYEEDVVSGMPPRSKLPDAEIEILTKWVAMGAPDPRAKQVPSDEKVSTFNLQSRKAEHWSWRPVSPPNPPQVSDQGWPLNEIDQFVLAKLEQAELVPAVDADKQLWLRRVYFDLIGLPPTTQQMDMFLQDDSAEAHQHVVDELLRSPHFGEKWARHWMDLVRYAETYGHEFDYPIHHATEYRDYLIRAFNADVPFDQFTREHIAGDLLPEPRRHPEQQFNESIIGTGFWYLHEATHAPTDVLGNEADIVDNQLDVFGKAFLGLTVACARCHDHKFDAISTADYYALSAYLQSSCRQEVSLDVGGNAKQLASKIEGLRSRVGDVVQKIGWQEEVDWRPGKYYATAAGLLRAVDPASPLTRIDSKKVTAEAVASAAERDELETDRLQRWVDHFAEVQRAIAPSDEGPRDDRITILADFAGDEMPLGWSTSGDAFQYVGSASQLTADGQLAAPGTMASGLVSRKQTGILRSPTFEITGKQIHLRMRSDANLTVRLVVDNYYMAHFNGLLFRGTFLNGKATDTAGQWAWKTLGGDVRKYVGHRAYLEFIDSGDGSMEIDQVVMSDGGPPSNEVGSLPSHAAFANQNWRDAMNSLRAGKGSKLMSVMLAAGLIRLNELAPAVEPLLKEAGEASSQLPGPRLVVAMAQGSAEDANIYIRGSHANLGPEVPARFLEALGGRRGDRLTLADQVVSEENPLTSRVAVNRLWHHLFGRGIVPTVDDFGPQGQPASHPGLLDWLAADFVSHGWSIKQTLRKITLSRTYRQSSTANPSLAETKINAVDPRNELLHCMPVRRLPAESIRDAILSVAGTLDSKQFGPSIPTHRTPFMTGRGARASGPLDGARRRSVYLSVYRNFLNPFMLTFDTPSPFGPQGRRSRSNVPAQALAMMNDPFVIDQAKRWAELWLKQDLSESDRITGMVRAAHGVEPNADQLAALQAFIDQQADVYGKADQRRWFDLAHTLFNMKAFYFVR
ncbi:PSD1 and planctomycete cytochrome C domain-containing protein [Rubripirellula sp.]|nr:PSD1 and planctomycete cytochrome C domain-containing protein [Rubripirellula sp.]